ncbi:MAG: hypothetical protein KBF59_10380 [Ignavibacterium sp.]|nr:hypothetical protein [Ignavibacterium sp.]
MNPSKFPPSPHYPFGMLTPGRNWSAGSADGYRFGFNGMESDDEIHGNELSYSTTYRMYDPRLGRWLSLDPKTRAFESPFVSFSNSPIVKVDPNGDSDYYTQDGDYIGSDGTKGADIFVITDKSVTKQIKAQTKETLKNSDYAIATIHLSEGTFFMLPSYEDRQAIKNIMQGFDQGESMGMERGGRGLSLDNGEHTHLRAEDGLAPSPSDPIAQINLRRAHSSEMEKINDVISNHEYEVEYTWHAHPNVTWYSLDDGKTWLNEKDFNGQLTKSDPNTIYSSGTSYKTLTTSEGASEADLSVEDTQRNFAITPKYNKVFYYTPQTSSKGKTSEGYFKEDIFYDVKAKDPQ